MEWAWRAARRAARVGGADDDEEEDCPNRRSHRMTSLGVPIVSTISRMRCAASAVQMSLREPRAG